MMSIKEAYAKAAKNGNGLPLRECYDIGDAWAFYFDENTESSGGVPFVVVPKNGGKVELWPVPPVENLRKILSGKKIDTDAERLNHDRAGVRRNSQVVRL
jgi:hypothetical protein